MPIGRRRNRTKKYINLVYANATHHYQHIRPVLMPAVVKRNGNSEKKNVNKRYNISKQTEAHGVRRLQ